MALHQLYLQNPKASAEGNQQYSCHRRVTVMVLLSLPKWNVDSNSSNLARLTTHPQQYHELLLWHFMLGFHLSRPLMSERCEIGVIYFLGMQNKSHAYTEDGSQSNNWLNLHQMGLEQHPIKKQLLCSTVLLVLSSDTSLVNYKSSTKWAGKGHHPIFSCVMLQHTTKNRCCLHSRDGGFVRARHFCTQHLHSAQHSGISLLTCKMNRPVVFLRPKSYPSHTDRWKSVY